MLNNWRTLWLALGLALTAFFTETFFPLGDIRWLHFAFACFAIGLAPDVYRYLVRRRSTQKGEPLDIATIQDVKEELIGIRKKLESLSAVDIERAVWRKRNTPNTWAESKWADWIMIIAFAGAFTILAIRVLAKLRLIPIELVD